MSHRFRPFASALAWGASAALALCLAGCGSSSPEAGSQSPSASANPSAGVNPSAGSNGGNSEDGVSPSPENRLVRVVTHDSFSLSPELSAQFTAETGYQLELIAKGSAGSVVSQLILTKDDPIADAAFGVDNNFASRALAENVFAEYESPALPSSAAELRADGSLALTPIDQGEVCVNVDSQWFVDHEKAEPESFADLADPAFANLFVTMNPATSSPGLSFLIATVGKFGEDGYLDFWAKLKENGVAITDGWTDAYQVDYTASAENGTRPIMVSYSTTPTDTLVRDHPSTTLLSDTCFRQVEYAGVLTGAKNPAGAQAFIDFLLSRPVQESFPEAMYMYPVDPEAKLPDLWAKFAPLSQNPIQVPAALISQQREEWIRAWTDQVIG